MRLLRLRDAGTFQKSDAGQEVAESAKSRKKEGTSGDEAEQPCKSHMHA